MSHQQSQKQAGQTTLIQNAQIVTPDAVVDGAVRIDGDRIVGVGDVADRADQRFDADGRLLLPGLIDIHGDDIESHLYPRAGARMDTQMALTAADRANIAAGITTKFHAISFEVAPDENRSPELGAEITRAVTEAETLMADHRIHARCEVTQEACVEAVTEIIEMNDASLVSVMSHLPGKGQFPDREAFRQYYRDSQNHTQAEVEEIIELRSELDIETIRDRVTQVVSAASEQGVPTASHDDEEGTEVERLHDVGVDISEYPITLETARRADELGMTVTMGSPNLVRGESQWGNLRTADAIEAGVVDTLVADYHPMSLLAATFVETGESLPERVARVTANPADAVGLSDRGRIRDGAEADLIVVDREPTPAVTRAFVAGEPVYRAEGSQ